MYKLEITLKQHTPMIHFQYDQSGATLRASEVKPKLDKFILTKLGKNPTDEQIKLAKIEVEKDKKNFDQLDFDQLDNVKKGYYVAKGSKWLIGKGDNPALNYSIKITPKNQNSLFLKTKKNREGEANPVYFANMADGPYKHYSKSESVNMEFFSICNNLDKIITEKGICEFFLLNNFGTRKTKGLGCFYPKKYDGKEVNIKPENVLPDNYYKIDIQSVNDRDIFFVIDHFWKRLKSGINPNNDNNDKDYNHPDYRHSLLKLFLLEKEGYRWEKPKIKEYFLGAKRDDSSISYFFARAFLGLANNFFYKSVHSKKQRTGEVYPPCDLIINIEYKVGSLIENNENKISRNPSPITFVPFKWDGNEDEKKNKTEIFLLMDLSQLESIANKTFKLKAIPKQNTITFKEADGNEVEVYIQSSDAKEKLEEVIKKAQEVGEYKIMKTAKAMLKVLNLPEHEIITPPIDNFFIENLLDFAVSKIENEPFEEKNFKWKKVKATISKCKMTKSHE